MHKFTLIAIILCQISALPVQAGGLDGFLKFTQGGGAITSVNAPGIIQDQQAGHLTGGSIISRGPRPMELQPLSVQLPSADFDPCTGSFDLRFGGFSFIKGKELVEFFKKASVAAGAYVAKMAIKSACPQCEDIMTYLESVARDINGMNLDQCEAGKAIAEGLMARFNSGEQQKCLAKNAVTKSEEDLNAAKDKCQKDPNKHGEAGDEDELKSMLPDNYNLVWKALSHGNSSSPGDMKELIMSISGSIIGRKIDGTATIATLPSLVEKEDLLERYIGKAGVGVSKVKMYVCDDRHKCLNPVAKEIHLDAKDSLYGKVEKNLITILEKIEVNKGLLSDEEQALIEFSQIPLISLLEIELALRGKDSVASFAGDAEFIEVVCYDMISNFMRKMLAEAKAAVDELQTAQIDNTPIERFNENIRNVQGLLRDKRYHAMQKLNTIVAVKERLNQQQKVFQLGFSRAADN